MKKLTSLVLSYRLQDWLNSTGAVVETRYVYIILNAPGAFKSRLFFSSTNTMVGKVVTVYDSQRRLLAGSLEMASSRRARPARVVPRVRSVAVQCESNGHV
jgi:hypothetical protein